MPELVASRRPDAPEHAGQLLIGGHWRRAAATDPHVSPADPGRTMAEIGRSTPDDVAEAYAAAAAAQVAWAADGAGRRSQVLHQWARLVEDEVEELAQLLAAEEGKALRDARGEAKRTVQVLRWFAGEALQPAGDVHPRMEPDTLPLTIERPLGVIACLTPWNFPLAIPAWKIAPALAYGNAVVWKPSEMATCCATRFAELGAAAGLPDGVLNLLPGPGAPISDALTEDPRLAALTFTGSTRVGRLLQAAAAGRGVRVGVEMGGKNAAVVLADADLDDAADQIVRGAMLATGQRCTATSRLYVERAAHDALLERIVARVEALVVGDPLDEATQIGPVVNRTQFDRVAGYLAQTADAGIALRAGGTAGDPAGGFYVDPTVVTGVPDDHPLLREEIFGPLLAVVAVDDLDDAIARVNASEYGLSAAIFTRDLAAAMGFAERVEAGMVHVNRETGGADPHVPFGGDKASSALDREQGVAARRFFTTTRSVYVRVRERAR